MMKPEEAAQIIDTFNMEKIEGIKHLLGTTEIVDPYDIEEGEITTEEAVRKLQDEGYRILELLDPIAIGDCYIFLIQNSEFIAGVRVFLNFKTHDVHRQMVAAEDVPASMQSTIERFVTAI